MFFFKNTKESIIKIILLFATVYTMFFIISCSNDDINSPIVNPKDSIFFEAPSGTVWNMRNDFGDSAYFKTFDTVLNARFAPVFWDTNKHSCFYIKAIPIRFTYWDGKMKKYEDYALGITDSGYVFATNKNPMINPNYPLEENFYSVLFFISNKEENNSLNTEFILKDSLYLGNDKFYVEQKYAWSRLDLDTFEVVYRANREKFNPYYFSEKFKLAKKTGFISFRGYNLINKI